MKNRLHTLISGGRLSSRIAVVAGIFLLMSITGVVANAEHGGLHGTFPASYMPMFQHGADHAAMKHDQSSNASDENSQNGNDKNGKKDKNCDPEDQTDQTGYQSNCPGNGHGDGDENGHGHGNGDGDENGHGHGSGDGGSDGNSGGGHPHGHGHGGD